MVGGGVIRPSFCPHPGDRRVFCATAWYVIGGYLLHVLTKLGVARRYDVLTGIRFKR